MERLLHNIKVVINDKIYIKDPESSDLGKKIIEHSILLIDEIGFDRFTFKKLGEKIGSNESSIYRYFENKHKLLLYLASWYWGWLEYRLVFATNSISNAKIKLQVAIDIVTSAPELDGSFSHINEKVLNNIIINEYSKSFLTKEVDIENKEGYFSIYKRLVNRLREMIEDVNPSYPYPACLASTILEGALHQHFIKDHFQSITDCNGSITPSDYFSNLVQNVLTNHHV
ncbi:TetR/AcrR family transcriptional regulator [Sungkyunkwania multivorans]|uniref:TetR/AcrR family transcriptional regulator n=1 Tax=Sungkyunkwania multivorans TaxID=1173618 RepID=A0ABW3CYT5_9FLAO